MDQGNVSRLNPFTPFKLQSFYTLPPCTGSTQNSNAFTGIDRQNLLEDRGECFVDAYHEAVLVHLLVLDGKMPAHDVCYAEIPP